MLAALECDEPLRNKSTVSPAQRHNVSYTSQAPRDATEPRDQAQTRAAPKIATTQLTGDRNQCQKHQTNSGKLAQPRKIIGAVRIDNSDGFGKLLIGLMMVDHDRIETKLFRFGKRLDARHTAIDGDQQFRTPRSPKDRIASTFGPYPSKMRSGM